MINLDGPYKVVLPQISYTRAGSPVHVYWGHVLRDGNQMRPDSVPGHVLVRRTSLPTCVEYVVPMYVTDAVRFRWGVPGRVGAVTLSIPSDADPALTLRVWDLVPESPHAIWDQLVAYYRRPM